MNLTQYNTYKKVIGTMRNAIRANRPVTIQPSFKLLDALDALDDLATKEFNRREKVRNRPHSGPARKPDHEVSKRALDMRRYREEARKDREASA